MSEIEQQNQVAGFISKTFQILSNNQFHKIVFWGPQGDEFIIKDNAKFEQVVLPRYFRHNKMNSFIRQLNMYGFHKSRRDNTKSVFSHPLFHKEKEQLLIEIKRRHKPSFPETPVKRNCSFPEELPVTAEKEWSEFDKDEVAGNKGNYESWSLGHPEMNLAKSFAHLPVNVFCLPSLVYLEDDGIDQPKFEENQPDKNYQAPSLNFLFSTEPLQEDNKIIIDYSTSLRMRLMEEDGKSAFKLCQKTTFKTQ